MKFSTSKYSQYLCLIICILSTGIANAGSTQGKQLRTTIQGHLDISRHADSIMLYLWEAPNIADEQSYRIKVNNGAFSCTFSIDHPSYISLGGPDGAFLNLLLVEPGDSIHLSISKEAVFISGKGFSKYRFQQEAIKRFVIYSNWKKRDSTLTYRNKAYFDYLDSCIQKELANLASVRDSMMPMTYEVLCADVISQIAQKKIIRVQQLLGKPDSMQIARRLYADHFVMNRLPVIPTDTTALSLQYMWYLWQDAVLNYLIFKNPVKKSEHSIKEIYHLTSSYYSGKIKERLQAQLILFRIKQEGLDPDLEYCIHDYLSDKKNIAYRKLINDTYLYFRNSISAGKKAIPFALPDTSGRTINLNAFKGKVVLLDFWFYGCVGCIQMSAALRKLKETFHGNPRVAFVNISVDRKRENWLKGIHEYKLQDAVNLYTEGLGENHTIVRQYKINGYPRLILIDKEGKFLSLNPPDPRADNGESMKRMILEAIDS